MEEDLNKLYSGDTKYFWELLGHLSTKRDSEKFKFANNLFNTFKERRSQKCVTQLLEGIQCTNSLDAKCFCIKLLKKILIDDKPSIWMNLELDFQKDTKAGLLSLFQNEKDTNIKEKIGKLIGSICIKYYDPSFWPELIVFIIEKIKNESNSDISTYCLNIMNDAALSMIEACNANELKQILMLFLNCTLIDCQCKSTALKTATKYTIHIIKSNIIAFEEFKEYVIKLIERCYSFLSMIEDKEEWYVKRDDYSDLQEVMDGKEFEIAIFCLEEIASLEDLYPFIMHLGEQCFNSGNWKQRYALLSVIGSISDICCEKMMADSRHFINFCINTIEYQNQRLKWKCINTIALLFDAMGHEFNQEIIEKSIDAILKAAKNANNENIPFVQEYSLRCLINILGKISSDNAQVYISNMLQVVLEIGENTQNNFVKIAVTNCLANIAIHAKEDYFSKYYMDCLKFTLSLLSIDTHKNAIIPMTVLNTMTDIAIASGITHIKSNIKDILQTFLNILNKTKESQDKQICLNIHTTLLNSISQICDMMEIEFGSHYKVFMPMIKEGLKMSLEFEAIDMEDADINKMEDNIIELDGCLFKYDMNILQFRLSAMTASQSFAENLGSVFFSDLIDILDAFGPALNYKYIKKIRHHAIKAQPSFLDCAIKSYNDKIEDCQIEFIENLIKLQWNALLGAIETLGIEDSQGHSTAAVVIETLAEMIGVCSGNIKEPEMVNIMEKIREILEVLDNWRVDRWEEENELLNEEEMLQIEEEKRSEEKVFNSLMDFLSMIIQNTEERYIELYKSFFYRFSEMVLLPQTDIILKEKIYTFYKNIIEYSNLKNENIIKKILDTIVEGCNHEDEGIRYYSSLGLLSSFKHNDIFKSYVITIINALVTSLSKSDYIKPEHCDTTNNLLVVIGNILELYPEELRLLEQERISMINIWLNMLPLKSNIDIAHNIHEQLITMVEFNYKICHGTNVFNFSILIPKLVEILNENLATKETSLKILTFLHNFDIKNPGLNVKEMILPEAISRA